MTDRYDTTGNPEDEYYPVRSAGEAFELGPAGRASAPSPSDPAAGADA